MSQFQTESQWENEIQTSNDNTLEMKKKSGLAVNSRALIVIGAIVVVAVIALLGLYIFGRPITGVWVRQMDDNSTLAGMTVEVRRNGGQLEGVIIAMPDGATGFEVGQIKWAQIKKIGFGKYKFYSLGKNDDYFYRDNFYAIVAQSGDQLTLSTDTSERMIGKYQIWVKQK